MGEERENLGVAESDCPTFRPLVSSQRVCSLWKGHRSVSERGRCLFRNSTEFGPVIE